LHQACRHEQIDKRQNRKHCCGIAILKDQPNRACHPELQRAYNRADDPEQPGSHPADRFQFAFGGCDDALANSNLCQNPDQFEQAECKRGRAQHFGRGLPRDNQNGTQTHEPSDGFGRTIGQHTSGKGGPTVWGRE